MQEGERSATTHTARTRNGRVVSSRVQGGGWSAPQPPPRKRKNGRPEKEDREVTTRPHARGGRDGGEDHARPNRPRLGSAGALHQQQRGLLQYAGAASSQQERRKDEKRGHGEGKGRERVREGLVVLRGFLDAETQRWLAQVCFSMGDEETSREAGNTGFYTCSSTASGRGVLRLNMGTRGRMIDSTSSFPPRFSELCVECLRAAQEIDDSMPDMEPNTLLINFYKPNASFKWHTDSENPQLVRSGRGKPVISFSIGLSCDFGFKDDYDSSDHQTVRLDSGDVFIFGGRSRMIVHSVLRVIPHTMPGYMRQHMREGRLNITFRDVDGYLDPTQFPRYRVTYDIEAKRSDPKEEEKA